MKKIFLTLVLFLLTSVVAFSQYDVVDSVTTALQISRAAVATSDSGTAYITPYQFSQVNIQGDTLSYTAAEIDSLLGLIGSIAGLDSNAVNTLIYNYLQDSSGTSVYTLAEIDSLLGLIAAGDSVDHTAAELELALDNLMGGTAGQVLTKTDGTDYNFSWQPAGAASVDSAVVLDLISTRIPRNKTVYNITEMAYIDTFLVFWVDDDIIIDSVKAESDDSVSIQVNINYENSLFTEGTLVNGTTTVTSFQHDTILTNKKAYLYFTYVGDNVGYLRVKFYWRYL